VIAPPHARAKEISRPTTSADHGPVTFVRADAAPADAGHLSTTLPADILEQVRGRVRLIALLMAFGFAFDPLVFVLALAAQWAGAPVEIRNAGFAWINVGVSAASLGLWLVARSRVSTSRLHTLGLLYEIALCFVIALTTTWTYYLTHGTHPNLTWVPAVVILFPLVLPGPPRRMLAAAVLSGASQPAVIWLLDTLGEVPAGTGAYFDAVVTSSFGVLFAYVGGRVVYGLGRQVAAARELGSYRLDVRLGAGGMGEVWRARHRMLARPAAIKLIRPSVLHGNRGTGISPDARRRFEREAQAIARLCSPHTVHLFDFGIAADGACYYVMELLEGVDAHSFVKRFGPVPAARVVHLLLQMCHSLSEADACGLVHRDIKPANVFLCRYGEDCDFVKVLDFGLVTSLRDDTETGATLTSEHAVRGTPAFMPPEQALGQPLDGRADIYATGCVAYWLLTGRLVFTAATPMALLMQHVHTAPAPPSACTELPVPPALDRLVLACLAKDPGDRPQSASDLRRQLLALDGIGTWTGEDARRWWAEHLPGASSGAASPPAEHHQVVAEPPALQA